MERDRLDATTSDQEQVEQYVPEEMAHVYDIFKTEHERNPFPGQNDDGTASLRRTFTRAMCLAEKHGYADDLEFARGTLEGPGISVQHAWLEYRGYVIDLYYPLFSQGIDLELKRLMTGETSSKDMVYFLRNAPLEKRVIGHAPDGFMYFFDPKAAYPSIDTEKYDLPPLRKQ